MKDKRPQSLTKAVSSVLPTVEAESEKKFISVTTQAATNEHKKSYSSHEHNSLAGFVADILHLFGDQTFITLKDNPNFQIPYANSEDNVVIWLTSVIKTLFSPEDLQQLQHSFYHHQQQNAFTIRMLTEKLASCSTQEPIQRPIEETTKNHVPLQVSFDTLLDTWLVKQAHTQALYDVLKQAIHDPSDDTSKFMLGFFKAWTCIDKACLTKNEDESLSMHAIHSELTVLLAELSECDISLRRPILKEVARSCSHFLSTYEFISPEDSLHIDPALHNASGIGGMEISEGISYAVIRAETKQTVIYADVKIVS